MRIAKKFIQLYIFEFNMNNVVFFIPFNTLTVPHR
jgi:hypothetical protein